MRRSIAFLLGFLCPLALAAADREIPCAKLHAMFSRVAQLQGGTYFEADARLASNDPAVPTANIRLVIRSRAGEIPVPVAADGTTRFPLSDALLEENPPVATNVAKGQLAFNVALRVEAPPAQRFRYGLMVAMRDEAAAMIAKQGMMARMLAPDFGGLQITFLEGTAATATVETAKGPVRFHSDAQGRIRIPDRRDWRRENPFIQLSAMPVQITLQTD